MKQQPDHKLILEALPKTPGVYLFKNSEGELLYVGKAKDIKKRVASHFYDRDQGGNHEQLIAEFASIDHIATRSDLEALLLEAHLIHTFQPPFNILLKEGNPFLYLLFAHDGCLPTVEIVRTKVKKKGNRYLGPFLHKQDARRVYDYLIRTFRLFLCNKTMEHGCLDYHIGRCAGACRADFDKTSYCIRLELAYRVLAGNFRKFAKEIGRQITLFNKNFEFERSRQLHECLEHAEHLFNVITSHFSTQRYQKEIEAKIITPPIVRDSIPYAQKATELQQMFNLPQLPVTIDCFDISHFQSRGIVGSCVRFRDGEPDKKAFRHFHIRSITEQNDYAALQEIVRRRYKNGDDKPDLVLIDGGKGQLNAVFPLTGTTPCVSLAKREERIFTPQNHDGILLNTKSPAGRLLISLRDYAHHFAISFHRTKNTLLS